MSETRVLQLGISLPNGTVTEVASILSIDVDRHHLSGWIERIGDDIDRMIQQAENDLGVVDYQPEIVHRYGVVTHTDWTPGPPTTDQ